ncbi:MAG TPA: hypothetical protein VNT22_08660, partial [Baekduia sp.]|nr:hypothetical protein [Baekduia sp.]
MGPNLADRFITPFDVNWFHAVRFDHDFIGRDALEPLAGSPPRTLVTLEWNPDDVLDVYRSMFGPGPRHRHRAGRAVGGSGDAPVG